MLYLRISNNSVCINSRLRLEKQFGAVVAIIVSGLMFALYHIGYSGFRTVRDILLLLAVGVGFAVSFKLAKNNLIVSYFVNLPNAFITHIFKYNQFPQMTVWSTIYAGITITLIIVLLFTLKVKFKDNNPFLNIANVKSE